VNIAVLRHCRASFEFIRAAAHFNVGHGDKMLNDPYIGFAERYDWMKGQNPDRDLFFRKLFESHKAIWQIHFM
jgi:hypothetical protein